MSYKRKGVKRVGESGMNQLSSALIGLNHWWRYLVLFVSSLAVGVLFKVVIRKIVQLFLIIPPDHDGITSNLDLFLAIVPNVACVITLLLLFKPLHRRNYKLLITGSNSVRWDRFFFALVLWMGFYGIYLFCDYQLNPTNFTLHFEAKQFIYLVIISLTLIPFQASYEELLMRGYFAQGIGVLTRSRLFVILIPSIIFGLMHSFDPDVAKYGFWITMPQLIIYGLMFGLITVLDNGLELAMGAHAANNIFLIVFVTSNGSSLLTPSLFIQNNTNAIKDLYVLIIMAGVFIAILSYKYRWNYSMLKQKIDPIEEDAKRYEWK